MGIPVGTLAKAIGIAAPVLLEVLKEYSSGRDRQKLDEDAVVNLVVETPEVTDTSSEKDGDLSQQESCWEESPEQRVNVGSS